MPQIQIYALEALRRHLPELVEQLKIANKLKAWELKCKHCELGSIPRNAIEIDAIMKG